MASSRIRAMLQSDVPFVKKGLGEIFLRSTFEDFRVFLTEEVAEQKAWRDFETNRNNEKTKLKVFVAASNQAIEDMSIGFVSVGELFVPELDIRVGFVFDLFVGEHFRNKGVGNELLEYGLSHLKNQGYSFASINTSAANESALHLYRKNGFRADYVRLTKTLR